MDVLLPEPAMVTSLGQLAAHDDPAVQAQATEISALLALPLRLVAAERLLLQGQASGAARCIWPHDTSQQDRFLRALARALADGLRPFWQAHCPGDPRLDVLYEILDTWDPTRAPPHRAHRLCFSLARDLAPSQHANMAAAAAVALFERDAQVAIQHVTNAVSRLDPTSVGRQGCAFLRRTLSATPLIGPETRQALAAAFARTLDLGALERAALLLDPGCAYACRGETIHGVPEILASWRATASQLQERFPQARTESQILHDQTDPVLVQVHDHLLQGERAHTFSSQMALFFDDVGRIWRIEHRDLPGQIDALTRFLHAT